MKRQDKKLVPGGVMLLLLLLLAACGTGGTSGISQTADAAQQQGSTTAIATITPQLVTPKTVSGAGGKGPIVIASPTAVPGGKPGSQQIVLADRTLIINSVTRQNAASTSAILITLDLTVRNTSAKAIKNQATFFQLMASEGDAFGYQYNSSDTFYGAIAAHTTRAGTIVFEVPTAAAAGLSLYYRPEIVAETALIRLKTA